MAVSRRLSAYRRRRAHHLAQKGHSPAEIAAKLQCSVHDVELELDQTSNHPSADDENDNDEPYENQDSRYREKSDDKQTSQESFDGDKVNNTKQDSETVDQLVGRRLRQARISASLSQSNLASFLGVSYQQMQKYEKGLNEVNASTLYRLATFFGVPISYFFGEEAERPDYFSNHNNEGRASTKARHAILPGDVATREAVKLARFYNQIKHPRKKSEFLDTVRRLAGDGTKHDDGSSEGHNGEPS